MEKKIVWEVYRYGRTERVLTEPDITFEIMKDWFLVNDGIKKIGPITMDYTAAEPED